MLGTVFMLLFTHLFLMLHLHTPENISNPWVPNAFTGNRNAALQRDESKLFWLYVKEKLNKSSFLYR